METKELTCVNCPMGCTITVTLENGEVKEVKGYTCEKGKAYALQESIQPMRILTSTVKIENAMHRVLPVITSKEIPLNQTFEAMEVIRKVSVQSPVHTGDVVIENLLGLGVDVLAARNM